MKARRWVMAAALNTVLGTLLGAMSMNTAQAQTPQCKRHERIAKGGDVQIRRAPDGTLWYAAQERIVKVDSKFNETPFVPVNGATTGLSGLALDDDGNVWYSKSKAGVVGRFPMKGGEGVEFALPERNSFPRALTLGPDGAMWYYDPVKDRLGRVGKDGSVTLIDPPPKVNPFMPTGLAPGVDQSMWVSDQAQNALFRYDIKAGSWKRFDIPEANAHPSSLRVARDGSVWFMMTAPQRLGRLRDGTFTSVEIGERPLGLHIADDQSVWYTTSRNNLGRIRPDGTREKYRCEYTNGPLTSGADGTIYALGGNHLLVLKPGDVVAAPVVASQSQVQGAKMMPLGPSPVRAVGLAELRKLFDTTKGRLIVHYTVHPKKGCGPCDESAATFEEFARVNAGKATFVRLSNDYDEAAWSDPWYQQNAALTGVPTFITYDNRKEIARVGGHEPVAVLGTKLLPPR